MQNPQRSFSGRRTTGTKTDTLPRTARSWIFLIIIRAHPAGKLGEGATAVTGAELCERLFQSTPPARGATALYRQAQRQHFDFNPRPPRGGRPYSPVREPRPLVISIHAPREGGDAAAFAPAMSAANFNPRPPRGGRHDPPGVPAVGADISIHAPREGGDRWVIGGWYLTSISIHAPREGGDGR